MPAISGDPPGALAISEVARLTGLTTATLRVWQRRYGLGASRSSPGGHRRYSPQDVARLRAVQRLVGQGLPTAEAVRVVLSPVEHGLDLPPEAHPVAHLLAAAGLDLDGPSCRSLVGNHLATHPADRTWEDVLRPVLAAVGERWAALPHGVAVEHVLSHVAAAALGATTTPRPPGPPTVLLACVPVEEHDLPIVALGAALAERGIAATLLGAATPADALARAVERSRPAVVMLLALLPELADPGVFGMLPPTDCLVAAGPGWDGTTVPGGVRRVGDLSGALQIVNEALGSPNPGPKGVDVRPPDADARRMDTTLTRHLPVATCIGCGARSHNAECADGCTDLPLDLVDVEDLVAIATRAEALEERVAELREVARALVEDDPADWPGVHERARAAVLMAVPEAPEIEVIEGWGCPRCGRVDAPQQCLGICIRRPGLVADITEYREYAAHAQRMAESDRTLSAFAHVVGGVHPRPGREQQTVEGLRPRARQLLERTAT